MAVIEGLSYNKLVEKLLDFRSLTGGAKDSGQPSLDTAANDGNDAETNSSQPAEPADVTKTEPEKIKAGDDVAVGEKGARDSTSSPGRSGGGPSLPVEGNNQGI